jgi:hypothetical protein
MKVSLALELLLNLLIEAQRISALIAHAQDQGREKLTDAEMAAVQNAATAAEKRLADAIAKAKE